MGVTLGLDWHTAHLLQDMRTWFQDWQWTEGLHWLNQQTKSNPEYSQALQQGPVQAAHTSSRVGGFKVLPETRATSIFTKVTFASTEPRQAKSEHSFNRQQLLRHLHAMSAASGRQLYTQSLLNILSRDCVDLVATTEKDNTTTSLYDLLKLRLARNSCLLQSGDALQPYLFVGVDLSGIQDFIYTVHPKGALKTLRGRSFYLQLVVVDFVNRVLQALDLPDFHQVYVGGGGAYLLLPNATQTLRTLHETIEEVNRWFLQELNGKLFLAVGWVEMDDAGFASADVWGSVARATGQQKGQRYFRELAFDSPFNPLEPREVHVNECDVCHSDEVPLHSVHSDDPTQTERQLCKICDSLEKIGGDLPRSVGLRLLPAGVSRADIEVCGRGYALIPKAKTDASLQTEKFSTESPREWHFASKEEDFYRYERLLEPPGYAKADEHGQFWTFEQLASNSKGAKKLGVLRMDVDNLGQIFARGMTAKNRNFANVSALSRELSRFFSEQLNLLCQQAAVQGKGQFHVVYAGGDDLFMVGSWHELAEFAPEIQRAFTHYTCDNKHITISGGLIVADYHVPLYHLAHWAGQAEEQAKDHGKNRFTLFYQSIPITQFSSGNRDTTDLTSYEGKEVRGDKDDTQFPLDVDWQTLEKVRTELLKPMMELDLPQAFVYFGRNYADLMDRNATHFAKFLYQVARLQIKKPQEQTWQAVKTKLVQRGYYSTWRVVFTWLALWTREAKEHAGW